MKPIDCERAKSILQDPHEERWTQAQRDEVDAHVAGCAVCRQQRAAERALSELLLARLPRPPAPAALRAAIAALAANANVNANPPAAPAEARAPRRPAVIRGRWLAWGAAAMAAAAALLMVLRLPARGAPDAFVLEAVNNHRRVVYAQHPLEIERGGMHQVRPWFTGRLEFAPVLGFDGDDDFELSGGSVGYFIDRKAALFVFKHRLHTISLLEFRAEGLPWPRQAQAGAATHAPPGARLDGFNVLFWRDGNLGYALVSDAEPATLQRLAQKLSAAR